MTVLEIIMTTMPKTDKRRPTQRLKMIEHLMLGRKVKPEMS